MINKINSNLITYLKYQISNLIIIQLKVFYINIFFNYSFISK